MRHPFALVAILLAVYSVSGQSPVAVEREIIGHVKEIAKYGSYTGDFDEAKNKQANDSLKQTLLRNGNRRDVLQYAFPKLRDEMFIATSPDGKLRIYSWDLQTGGTMHDYSSVVQYQDKSGSVHVQAIGDEDEGSGAFTTQIFQLGSKTGAIYLTNSTFIAQGNIHGQSVGIIRINGNKLDRPKLIRTRSGLQNSIDFSYDPSSLQTRPEHIVFFDSTRQVFRFPVVIEDKEFGNGRVTNRFISYHFDGHYFVKAN